MISISKFEVVVPPTSGALREKALAALQDGGVLELVVRGTQEVPQPVDTPIHMQVSQILQQEGEGMRIGGSDVEGNSVRIQTNLDDHLPAIARLISFA